MPDKPRHVKGYAVLRVDHYQDADPQADPAEPGPVNVTVKEVVFSVAEALREVRRLNDLNAEKGCTHFWQGTHVFLDGGSHGDHVPSPK